MSEGRLGGVREASGSRCGRRPERVRRASETCLKGVRGQIGRANQINGRTARGCPIFSSRIVRLPSVFDDFRCDAFSTAGAMVLHDFQKQRACAESSKTQRLCTRIGVGQCKSVRFVRVLSLNCAFSLCLCSEMGVRRFGTQAEIAERRSLN